MTALDNRPYQIILYGGIAFASLLIIAVIALSFEVWSSRKQQDSLNKEQMERLANVRRNAEYKVQQAVDSVSIINIALQANEAKLTESINRYNKLKQHEPNLILLRGDTSAILEQLGRIRAEVGQD
jgi:hypothetical protein